jgi:hypothetical protein
MQGLLPAREGREEETDTNDEGRDALRPEASAGSSEGYPISLVVLLSSESMVALFLSGARFALVARGDISAPSLLFGV